MVNNEKAALMWAAFSFYGPGALQSMIPLEKP
jgi:hypothetical protein